MSISLPLTIPVPLTAWPARIALTNRGGSPARSDPAGPDQVHVDVLAGAAR